MCILWNIGTIPANNENINNYKLHDRKSLQKLAVDGMCAGVSCGVIK